ncbi:MAG: hypothetical protein AB8H03_28720 [Saprospiraceae bacterium]
MAELNKQIEVFLIHQRLEEEEDLKKILLAKEYEKRHQTSRLLKLSESLNNKLEFKKNKSLDDYYHGCIINDLLYYNPEVSAQWRGDTPLLNKADTYLDGFYLLGKWRYRSEFLERQRLLKEEDQPFFDLDILQRIGENFSIPVVNLYQKKQEAGKSFTEGQFVKLKKTYFDSFENMSFKDQQIFYFYLLNSLMGIIQMGKTKLFETLFDLYWFGIKKRLLLYHGRLSANTYANIITLGNRIKKFEEIDSFIKTYTIHLREEEQTDGATWGRAHWHFNKKEYENAIEYLRIYKFKNNSFEILGRFLLLQVYFELLRKDTSYSFLFFDYTKSLKKNIQRNKYLSQSRKKAFQNYIKYISKIAHVLDKKDKTKYQELIHQINNEEIIQGKRWMLETLDQIISEIKK